MSKKILIIGSGIAGISASLKLNSYGFSSVIVDKGKFLGGRIATRELKIGKNSNFFFHGAQFFIARHPSFKKIVIDGINNNYIKEYGNFLPSRYRGYPNMRNFLLNLSKNLNIFQNNKVIGLRPKNSKISVLTDTFYKWQIFDGVISTLPAPQNLLLMQEFPILKQTLLSARYAPCIALMFSFDKENLNIPYYFDFYNKESILSWMAAGSNLCFWTAHTKDSYSSLNLQKSNLFLKNEILTEIRKTFSQYKNLSSINFHQLHIWKYAKVKKVSKGTQIDPKLPIAIAGDFMEGPNVESAFISGEKAAKLIFNRLG